MQRKILYTLVLIALNSMLSTPAFGQECNQLTAGSGNNSIFCKDKSAVQPSSGSVTLTGGNSPLTLLSIFSRTGAPQPMYGVDFSLAALNAYHGDITISAKRTVLSTNYTGILAVGHKVNITGNLEYSNGTYDTKNDASTFIGAYKDSSVNRGAAASVTIVGNVTATTDETVPRHGIIEVGSKVYIKGNVDIKTNSAQHTNDVFSGGAVFMKDGSIQIDGDARFVAKQSDDFARESNEYQYGLIGSNGRGSGSSLHRSGLIIEETGKGGDTSGTAYQTAAFVSMGGTFSSKSLTVKFQTPVTGVNGVYLGPSSKTSIKGNIDIDVDSSRDSYGTNRTTLYQTSGLYVGKKAALTVEGNSKIATRAHGLHSEGGDVYYYPTVVGTYATDGAMVEFKGAVEVFANNLSTNYSADFFADHGATIDIKGGYTGSGDSTVQVGHDGTLQFSGNSHSQVNKLIGHDGGTLSLKNQANLTVNNGGYFGNGDNGTTTVKSGLKTESGTSLLWKKNFWAGSGFKGKVQGAFTTQEGTLQLQGKDIELQILSKKTSNGGAGAIIRSPIKLYGTGNSPDDLKLTFGSAEVSGNQQNNSLNNPVDVTNAQLNVYGDTTISHGLYLNGGQLNVNKGSLNTNTITSESTSGINVDEGGHLKVVEYTNGQFVPQDLDVDQEGLTITLKGQNSQLTAKTITFENGGTLRVDQGAQNARLNLDSTNDAVLKFKGGGTLDVLGTGTQLPNTWGQAGFQANIKGQTQLQSYLSASGSGSSINIQAPLTKASGFKQGGVVVSGQAAAQVSANGTQNKMPVVGVPVQVQSGSSITLKTQKSENIGFTTDGTLEVDSGARVLIQDGNSASTVGGKVTFQNINLKNGAHLTTQKNGKQTGNTTTVFNGTSQLDGTVGSLHSLDVPVGSTLNTSNRTALPLTGTLNVQGTLQAGSDVSAADLQLGMTTGGPAAATIGGGLTTTGGALVQNNAKLTLTGGSHIGGKLDVNTHGSVNTKNNLQVGSLDVNVGEVYLSGSLSSGDITVTNGTAQAAQNVSSTGNISVNTAGKVVATAGTLSATDLTVNGGIATAAQTVDVKGTLQTEGRGVISSFGDVRAKKAIVNTGAVSATNALHITGTEKNAFGLDVSNRAKVKVGSLDAPNTGVRVSGAKTELSTTKAQANTVGGPIEAKDSGAITFTGKVNANNSNVDAQNMGTIAFNGGLSNTQGSVRVTNGTVAVQGDSSIKNIMSMGGGTVSFTGGSVMLNGGQLNATDGGSVNLGTTSVNGMFTATSSGSNSSIIIKAGKANGNVTTKDGGHAQIVVGDKGKWSGQTTGSKIEVSTQGNGSAQFTGTSTVDSLTGNVAIDSNVTVTTENAGDIHLENSANDATLNLKGSSGTIYLPTASSIKVDYQGKAPVVKIPNGKGGYDTIQLKDKEVPKAKPKPMMPEVPATTKESNKMNMQGTGTSTQPAGSGSKGDSGAGGASGSKPSGKPSGKPESAMPKVPPKMKEPSKMNGQDTGTSAQPAESANGKANEAGGASSGMSKNMPKGKTPAEPEKSKEMEEKKEMEPPAKPEGSAGKTASGTGSASSNTPVTQPKVTPPTQSGGKASGQASSKSETPPMKDSKEGPSSSGSEMSSTSGATAAVSQPTDKENKQNSSQSGTAKQNEDNSMKNESKKEPASGMIASGSPQSTPSSDSNKADQTEVKNSSDDQSSTTASGNASSEGMTSPGAAEANKPTDVSGEDKPTVVSTTINEGLMKQVTVVSSKAGQIQVKALPPTVGVLSYVLKTSQKIGFDLLTSGTEGLGLPVASLSTPLSDVAVRAPVGNPLLGFYRLNALYDQFNWSDYLSTKVWANTQLDFKRLEGNKAPLFKLSLGADVQVRPDVRAGTYLTVATGSTTAYAQRFGISLFSLGAYTQFTKNEWLLIGNIAFSHLGLDTKSQKISFQSGQNALNLGVEAYYFLPVMQGYRVIPEASLQYTRVFANQFKGNEPNLVDSRLMAASEGAHSLRLRVGGRLAAQANFKQLLLGYYIQADLMSEILGGQQLRVSDMTTQNKPISLDTDNSSTWFRLGLGANLKFNDYGQVSTSGYVDFFGSHSLSTGFSLGVSYNF